MKSDLLDEAKIDKNNLILNDENKYVVMEYKHEVNLLGANLVSISKKKEMDNNYQGLHNLVTKNASKLDEEMKQDKTNLNRVTNFSNENTALAPSRDE